MEKKTGCRASVDFTLSEWRTHASRGGCMVYEDDVKGFGSSPGAGAVLRQDRS